MALVQAERAWLLITIAVLSNVVHLGSCQCELTFAVVPALSNFTFGGQYVAPIESTLIPLHPDALIGFQGSIRSQLESASCPATVEELLQQLPGATFSTMPLFGALDLFPPSIEGSGPADSRVAWQEMQFNLSTSPLQPAPASSAEQFTTQVSATITQGFALTTSLLSPTPEQVSLVNITASNSSQVTAAVTNLGNARVELRGLLLTFRSVYEGSLAGQPLTGILDYQLEGTLVLEAAVGCGADCGPRGVCGVQEAAASNSSSQQQPTPGPECLCQCGWTGASCDVPSGFCPRFLTDQAAGICPVPPPAPTPSPAPQPPSPCVPVECNSRQRFNSTTNRCDCLPGWSGPACQACQTDAACAAYHSVDDAVCSADFLFGPQSQFRAYTCDLQGTGLDDVIESDSFYFSCNTTVPDIPSAPSGQYCEVNFALKDKADNPITCRAYQCSFRVNSSRVDCATTQCECQSECPDVQGILDSAEGRPVWLDCSPLTGDCTIEIQDFFVTFVAPCTPAECLVEGYSLEEGTFTVTAGKNYNPVIAAVPLMGLVAVALFLSFYLITHRAFWAAARRPPLGGGGALPPLPLELRPDAVHELRFQQLSCSVQPGSGRFGAAGAAWVMGLCGRRGGAGGGGRREVLKGVSGVALRGELVGVLGPSGSGKTTLLSLLTGSTEDMGGGARLRGEVLLDGMAMRGEERKKVAFVPQDDFLLSTLTVAECLTYSALLRLPPSLSPEQLQARVWRVIQELGLTHVAQSRVGGQLGGRGISGGERRRVTIGMELVTDPAVLVLDEPTSGLDSFTALALMNTLKQVAGSGRIVVLTFHQPSPLMFNMLDRAYLMAGGECLFGGPPSAAEPHFRRHGAPCPVGAAVAEHMLQVVSDPQQLALLQQSLEVGGAKELRSSGSEKLLNGGEHPQPPPGCSPAEERGESSPPYPHPPPAAQVDIMSPSHAASPKGGLGGKGGGSPAVGGSLSRELGVVFWRTLVDILRNPSLLLLHWAMALGMGVLMGAIFYHVGLDISGAQNRAGGLFFALAFFAFTSLTTTDLLTAERRLVVREVRGGYYRPFSYLLSKAVLDALLLRMVPVFLYAASFYPMMGLQSGSTHVALFLMTLATFAVAVGALSLAVTVGCTTSGKASLVMNLILLISLLVGGFFVNVASIPAWIRWLHYVSLFYYSYAALITNEVASLSMDFVLEGYAAVSNVKGLAFLNIIGIDASNLTDYIIVLDCLYLACVLLAFGLLYLRMPRAKALRSMAK